MTDRDAALPAGYSDTPLVRKLGIVAGASVTFVHPPDHLADLLGPLPDGVRLAGRLGPGRDVVLFFTGRRRELEHWIERLGAAIHPSGMVWVCWPKKASKAPTDMSEQVVRDVAVPLGLVDTKVAAVDDTWSGLRLVWRRDRR